MDLRAPNGAGPLPALGLDVHDVESQSVLLHDSVDALVTGSSERLTGFEVRSPVAHLDEQLEHPHLALGVHRVDERLVAVAQVDRAPARGGPAASRAWPDPARR